MRVYEKVNAASRGTCEEKDIPKETHVSTLRVVWLRVALSFKFFFCRNCVDVAGSVSSTKRFHFWSGRKTMYEDQLKRSSGLFPSEEL